MAKDISCGVDFMRGILLFLNVLFIIVGLALIGVGAYIKMSDNFASILSQFTEISGFGAQSLGFLSFVMIGGGLLTLLIALFGCAGKFLSSIRIKLYLYSIYLKKEHYGLVDVL
jgi:hypothetical protein